MSRKEIIYAIIAAITSIIGALVFITLIQREEITFLLPNIQPIVLLLGAIIGYLIFKETMNKEKILGIILIILGAVIINFNKIKQNPINNVKVVKNSL